MATRGASTRGRGRGRGSLGPPATSAASSTTGAPPAPKPRPPREVAGPSPVFPPMESLPSFPAFTSKDRYLTRKSAHQKQLFKSSIYYLQKPSIASKKDVERYTDRYVTNKSMSQYDFYASLSIDSGIFPEELLPSKLRSAINRKRKALEGAEGDSLSKKRLLIEASGEELAKLMAEERESERKKENGDDTEEMEVVGIDEEEEQMDEDDYTKGQVFQDDDEGIEDEDEGADEAIL